MLAQPMRTRIKMCGITSVADMQLAVSAGADAIGLVFYPPSPRCVSVEQAAEILKAMPAFVTSVALFVNPEPAFVQTVIEQTQVDLLQFHGDESPAFCQQFDRPYIKAVRMQAETDLQALATAYASAQGLLVDTYKKGVPGGTGESFNWQWLPEPETLSLPLILAGGLNPENVKQAIEIVRPWAVDVSGGIEASPGKKSQQKVVEFVKAVNMR